MSRQPTPQQYLVLSALGEDRPGIVNGLAEQILEAGCNIIDSRMTVLGGEFAVLMMVEGTWNAVAKLEHLVPQIEKRQNLTVIAKRTDLRQSNREGMPYSVDVVSIDHPGIVYQLAGFFSSRDINIHDLFTDSYHAAHTGTVMFTANMTVSIPAGTQIARLREEFLDFCDALNLDAVLEPMKG